MKITYLGHATFLLPLPVRKAPHRLLNPSGITLMQFALEAKQARRGSPRSPATRRIVFSSKGDLPN